MRRTSVRQSEIQRAIRAVHAAGLTVFRVVVRADGVSIETLEQPDREEDELHAEEGHHQDRVVVL